jgi:hypothetical protein
MNNSDDANPLPANPIDDPIMPHDQLAYRLVFILRDDTP